MFRKILVPIDLVDTETTERGIDAGIAIATASGAEVRLLYVQFPMPSAYADFVPTDMGDRLRLASEQQIAEIADQIDYPKERLSTVVRFGPVYSEVLAEAEDWGADLIALCSHRPSMAAYFLGSNAQNIVRHAKRSVLIVRG